MVQDLNADATGRGVRWACGVLALAIVLALAALSIALWRGGERPLLLAPAIGGLSDCLDMTEPDAPLEAACTGAQGSAAARVQGILSALGPRQSPNGRLQVGYTLVVPLLNLFRPDAQADGGWAVDATALQRIARTVQGVDRPVVL